MKFSVPLPPQEALPVASAIENVTFHLPSMSTSPGDFLRGNRLPATEVAVDFVDILLDELSARGLDYVVAATSARLSLEASSATGDDLRLTDREVILARADVEISNVREENFDTNLMITVSGVPILFLRSWVSVETSTRLPTAARPPPTEI